MGKRWSSALAVFLVLGALPAVAAPPHPDLAEKIRRGEKPFPEYLRKLRDEGPPRLRGDRSVGKALKERKAKERSGGVLQSFPAPGGSLFEAAPAPPLPSAPAPPVAGNVKALALLVSFSDVSPSPTWTPEYFDALLFGAAAPSLTHYYREVSGNALNLETTNLPSTVGWLPLPLTKADYGGNLRTMLQDAVAAADGAVDFSQYDNDGDGTVDYLIVVHVGSGAEYSGDYSDIWSQTLSVAPVETADDAPAAGGKVKIDTFMTAPEYWYRDLTSYPMTVGVYAHEFGHLLGLPDLYDVTLASKGIGDWGLMSYGMWNGAWDGVATHRYMRKGESPAWVEAWGRVALGWVVPEAPATDVSGLVLGPVEAGGPAYYLWNHGLENGEFFLVENRQKLGYDLYLPGAGLLVWHVDENMPDNNSPIPYSAPNRHADCDWPNHYKVALQQADGFMNLEQPAYSDGQPLLGNYGDSIDPYPRTTTVTSFTSATTVNSGSYATCASLVAITGITRSGTDVIANVQVAGGDVPPVASDASVTTQEDVAAPVTLAATDAGGDPLTYAVVTWPSHGELSGAPPDLTYTPDPDYNGADSFTFEASDGYTESNVATVSITVEPVNDAPVASEASVGTAEDTAVDITLAATDIDSGSLTYAVATPPAHGILSGTPPALTYTPDADFNGDDSFTFTADDGAASSNVAAVSITVAAVNDPPVASGASVSTAEDTPLGITLSATDVDSGALTYAVVTPPSHGQLSGTPPDLTYTPSANFNGADSFTFTANDGAVDGTTATVSITVDAVNDAPVLGPVGDRSVTEGVPLAFTLAASDPEGDPLAYFAVGLPAGAALDETTGAFSWTPGFDAAGAFPVTFRVGDGALYDEETVTITVAQPVGPIFRDEFTSALASRPKWVVATGSWRWSNATRDLRAASLTKTNLARVALLDPASLPLGTGVVKASVKLTPQAGPAGPNGLIVFAYRDATHYRWVKVTPESIQIGQTGAMDGTTAGTKRRVAAAQPVNRAFAFTVKVRASGLVEVFKGASTRAAASYRFRAGTAASVVPGGVGLGSVRALTVFDSVKVWEDAALGE